VLRQVFGRPLRCLAQIVPRLLVFISLQFLSSPASLLVPLNLRAQCARRVCQCAHPKREGPCAFAVHHEHRKGLVIVPQITERLHIGSAPHEDRIRYRDQQGIAAPELARLTAEAGHRARLPIKLVLEETLNALDVARSRSVFSCLSQQLSQRKLVLVGRSAVPVQVQVKTQDRRIFAHQFGQFLEVLFLHHHSRS